MDYTFITIPVITSIVYASLILSRKQQTITRSFLDSLPLVAAVTWNHLWHSKFLFIPGVLNTENVFVALVVGAASGLAATGLTRLLSNLQNRIILHSAYRS